MPAKRHNTKKPEEEEKKEEEVVEGEEPKEEEEVEAKGEGEQAEKEEEEEEQQEKEEEEESEKEPVKKRPAAWHEQDEPEEPVAKRKKVQAAWFGQKDDCEDGVEDARTTSRCQRDIFKKHRHLLDAAVWKRYEELADPKTKMPGKQALINMLINAHVARDASASSSLTIKQLTAEKIVSHKKKDSDATATIGLGRWTMLGQCSSGNESLFTKALANGEVIQGQDGHFYMARRTRSHTNEKGELVVGETQFEASDAKQLLGFVAKFPLELEEAPLAAEWAAAPMQDLDESKADLLASDEDFKLMQGSFDCTTRVTLNIRRIGISSTGVRCSETLREMGRRALKLCKDIVEPSEALENLLVSERSEVRKAAVKDVLAKIAPPYKQLVELHNEIFGLIKSQKGVVKGKDMILKPIKL